MCGEERESLSVHDVCVCVRVRERDRERMCVCVCHIISSQGAPLRTDGDIPALKLTPHALNMFRTYIREGTPEYVKYSGVRLPEDHSDHAYFSRERRVGEGETGDAGLAVSGGAKGTVGEGAVGGAGGPDEGVVVAADEAMVGEEGGEEGAVALASAAVDAVGASAPADDAVVVAAPPVPPSAAVAGAALCSFRCFLPLSVSTLCVPCACRYCTSSRSRCSWRAT